MTGNQFTRVVKIGDAMASRMGLPAGDNKIDIRMTDAGMASGIAFAVSQLAALEKKAYETPYAKIVFKEIVPIDTTPNEGAIALNYFSFDGVAKADWIGSSSNDLPSVGLLRQMHTVPFGYAGIALEYNLNELRAAALVGQDLNSDQAVLCHRAAEEMMQHIVFYGDKSRGMKGFFNDSNVETKTSTLDWTAKDTTADDIIADLNAALEHIWLGSKQTYVPNTILIDGTRYAILSKTRLSQYNDKTLLTYFKENNVVSGITAGTGNVDIRPLAQLEASEMKANKVNSGKARMVVYDRNPINMSAYMPIAPRFIAPQAIDLKIRVPMEFKCSGTEIKYPQSVVYVDEK